MARSDTAEVTQEDTETLTSKEVAIIGGGATGVMIGGVKYDVKNQVNLPTLKHESGETVAVRIDAPIREEANYKDEIQTVDGEKKVVRRETIINVVRVTELSSNQAFEYVCNAMTADNIRGAYPNHSYVGLKFAIQKLGTVAGKQYKQTNVVELEEQS